jgi:uncharacterized oxidoreductase
MIRFYFHPTPYPAKIALFLEETGLPYATCAAVKAGLAHFGEALRRELLGMAREPAVADAIVAGIENNSLEVVRGGEERQKMIKVNREDPGTRDRRFAAPKPRLEDVVREHSAL